MGKIKERAVRQLTQREYLKHLVERVQLDANIAEFERVLGQAQNRPPHGEADGSIDEKTFNQARKTISMISEASWELSRLASLLELAERCR